jgi:hypothetical protein
MLAPRGTRIAWRARNEKRVTEAVRKLIRWTTGLPSDLAELTKTAQAVRYMAREQGRLEEATKLAKDPMRGYDGVGAKTIAEAKAEVRKLFISQIF